MTALLFLGITSCDEGPTGTVEPAGLDISPASVTLDAIGATRDLAAVARTAAGGVVTGVTVTWASSDSDIATVSEGGVVTAVSNGTAQITATVPEFGVSGSLDVVVRQVVTALSISLAEDTIRALDGTTQAAAQAEDRLGNAVTDASPAWSVSPSSVATISATGLVTAVANGEASVRAMADGVSATRARVTVAQEAASVAVVSSRDTVEVGDTLHVSADVADANGYPVGSAVAWESDDASVIRGLGGGRYLAAGPGTATVTATAGSAVGERVVVVEPAVVVTVTISPAGDTLKVGQTSQLAATPRDKRGTVLTGRPVSWSSSATGVVTVSAEGLITAQATGSAVITATIQDSSATATILVVPPVDSVAISPGVDTIYVDSTVQLTATPLTAGGQPVAQSVTWSSSNRIVARVDADGLVTGFGPGTATITAQADGKSSGAAITVIERVSTVTLTPAPVTLYPPNLSGYPSSATLTATLQGPSGDTLGVRPITWTSTDTLVATVDTAGQVTALTEGTATVAALSEGVAGLVQVTVDSLPIDTVVVSPAQDSVVEFQTVQLTATVQDSAGNPLAGRAVTWASADTLIATVASDGVVTGVFQGQTTITATAGGIGAGAVITVTPAVVDTVALSPAAPVIWEPNLSGQVDSTVFTAEPRDAAGNVIVGRTVTWTSSDTLVARVDAAGVARSEPGGGVATITATIGGIAGSESLTVNAIPVASVTITGEAVIFRDSTRQLTATVRDAGNTVLSIWDVAWSSLDTGIATVDATGVVTGVALGSTAIVANSEGVADTFAVTIDLAPVVVDADLGEDVGCAIIGTSAVQCWGTSEDGELGVTAASTDVFTPLTIQLPDTLTYTDVAVGGNHACVLDDTGDIRCWGRGNSGQLGHGAFAGSELPVLVVRPPGATFSSVSAGDIFTCATTTAADVYCWGYGGSGRLGNGSTSSVNTPTQVAEVGADFTQIDSGWDFTCGVDTFGRGWCWGWSSTGQLGNGLTSGEELIPVQVSMPATSFTQIRSSNQHTCALGQDGRVYCWGGDWDTQLGQTDWIGGWSTTPLQVQVTVETFVELGVSATTSCGIKADGSTVCWGANYYGGMGDGTRNGYYEARDALFGLQMAYIAGGRAQQTACGVNTAGEMYCWGDKGRGFLTNGATRNTTVAEPLPVAGSFDQVERSPWQNFTCATTDAGVDDQLFCWEDVNSLMSGAGESTTPVEVPLPAGVDVKKLDLGGNYACVLTHAGTIHCRGSNGFGQFGDGTTTSNFSGWSTTANPAGVSFVDIATGRDYTVCAVGTDGNVWCWGRNGRTSGEYAYGVFGDGTAGINSTVPVMANDPGVQFTEVALVDHDVCALTSIGDLYCWGQNYYGEAGLGYRMIAVFTPSLVSGGHTWTHFDVGQSFACAIDSFQDAYCWGAHYGSRLGNDATEPQTAPAPVSGGFSFDGVFAGSGEWACGINAFQEAYCWGGYPSGQVGNGTMAFNSTPTLSFGGRPVRDLAGGQAVGCIVDTSRNLYCSGFHEHGDTGLGILGYSLTPIRVFFP